MAGARERDVLRKKLTSLPSFNVTSTCSPTPVPPARMPSTRLLVTSWSMRSCLLASSSLRPTQRQLSSAVQQTTRQTWMKTPQPRWQRRYASSVATDARSVLTRSKNVLLGTGLILATAFTYLYVTDTRAGVHQWLVVPLMRIVHPDAEDAHHAGVDSLKPLYAFGLHPRERSQDDASGDLKVEVFGHVLNNPIGISAGLDKDAEIPDALLALGPALVEVGGVTPVPQPGNPKPRVFRIPSQNAIINRYGLNSKGADHMACQLRERVRQFAFDSGFGLEAESERMILDGAAGVPPGSLQAGKLLAIQIAKNKTTPDSDIQAVAGDYVYCVKAIGKYADVLVVNVSSPNTPGLRSMQAVEPLTVILKAVVQAANQVDRKKPPPVMVKVSPDESTSEQIEGICTAVWAAGVDGVIVANTTTTRPDPVPAGYIVSAKEQQTMTETGGYSGPQLFDKTLKLVKEYRTRLDQGASDSESSPGTDFAYSSSVSKVIWASGGISNGQQCLQVLNEGASLCMLYTAMLYGGVGLPSRMKAEMRDEIKQQGKPRLS